MADTAMSDAGSSEVAAGPDGAGRPPGTAREATRTAVWRLRSRGCWADAAALLADGARTRRRAAAGRAAGGALSLHGTGLGGGGGRAAARPRRWPAPTRSAAPPPANAATSRTPRRVLGVRDRRRRGRVPRSGGPPRCCRPRAPGRALLDFRRGLIAEHISRFPAGRPRRLPPGARGRDGARGRAAALLHLAPSGRARPARGRAGGGPARFRRVAAAPRGAGLLVGTAPALASLAQTEPEPEASRLLAEARRLFGLLGGVPTWLADQLAPAPEPL